MANGLVLLLLLVSLHRKDAALGPRVRRQQEEVVDCEEFCISWGIAEDHGIFDNEPFTLPCFQDPEFHVPNNTQCWLPGEREPRYCPSICDGRCNAHGMLHCDGLPETVIPPLPPLPPSCLQYCQNPELMPDEGALLAGDEYKISCGYIPANQSLDQCGELCPQCPRAGKENPRCRLDGQVKTTLRCPPLDPASLPKDCREFCRKEAGQRGRRLEDGPFPVNCGKKREKRLCNSKCPVACDGYCEAGILTCPAVQPITTSPKPGGGGGDKGKDGQETEEEEGFNQTALIAIGVVGGLLVVLLVGVVLCRWYREKRGRRAQAVAPANSERHVEFAFSSSDTDLSKASGK